MGSIILEMVNVHEVIPELVKIEVPNDEGSYRKEELRVVGYGIKVDLAFITSGNPGYSPDALRGVIRDKIFDLIKEIEL